MTCVVAGSVVRATCVPIQEYIIPWEDSRDMGAALRGRGIKIANWRPSGPEEKGPSLGYMER